MKTAKLLNKNVILRKHSKKRKRQVGNGYPDLYGSLPISKESRQQNFRNNNTRQRLKKRNINFFINDNSKQGIKKINEDLFKDKEIKVLANGSTGSNSVVFYIEINGYGYIYKITSVVLPFQIKVYERENEIYKRLLQLIFHNVTPHLLLTFDSGVININDDSKLLEKSVLCKTHKIDKKYYCQINETGSKIENVTTVANYYYNYKLASCIKNNNLNKQYYSNSNKIDIEMVESKYYFRIFYNILFQYLWTLNIFDRIGLNHNDLNLNNILIIQNDINIMNHPEDMSFKEGNIKYNTYKFYDMHNKHVKTYYLEDLGFMIHIYDFDKANFMKTQAQNPLHHIEHIISKAVTAINDMVNEKYKNTFANENIKKALETYPNLLKMNEYVSLNKITEYNKDITQYEKSNYIFDYFFDIMGIILLYCEYINDDGSEKIFIPETKNKKTDNSEHVKKFTDTFNDIKRKSVDNTYSMCPLFNDAC